MKQQSKIKKIVSAIILITTIIITSNSILGVTWRHDAEPYKIDPNLFCMDHSKVLGFKDQNGKSTDTMTYSEKSADGYVEPSTGYAFWRAQVDNDYDMPGLQNVVWASKQWGNASNVLDQASSTVFTKNSSNTTEARSYQYGTVYYGILQNLAQNAELFKTTTTENDIKVLVDQVDGTYTVGPYKLELNITPNQYTEEAKRILYNELIETGNQGFTKAGQFAKLLSITGINGNDIIFVDSQGRHINFPDFTTNQDFYIRFKPNSNGAINKTGVPVIKVSYLTKFYAAMTKYTPEAVAYDNYLVQASDDVTLSNVRVTGNEDHQAGGRKYQGIATATLHLKVTDRKTGQTWNIPVSQDISVYTWVGSNYQIVDLDGDGIDDHGYWNYDGAPSNGDAWSISGGNYTIGNINIDNSNAPGILSRMQPLIKIKLSLQGGATWADTTVTLPEKPTQMQIGGNVWVDLPENKTGKITGIKGNEDTVYAGMEVNLYDKSGNLVGTTTTDANGKYQFTGLNPLMKYFVKFTYNGQIYQSTYYKYNLSGGYSNAMDEAREAYNSKFESIYSDPANYEIGTSWRKSFALDSKLSKDDGTYISYNNDALRYKDAWYKFVEFAEKMKSYNSAYTQLDTWIENQGVGTTDRKAVIQFIKDCMIIASTHVDDPLTSEKSLIEYPVYNQFVLEDLNNPTDNPTPITLDKAYSYLYTKQSDQSRYVDYGITARENSDLALQKDVYKATVIVNGKSQEYIYNKKTANMDDDGAWNVEVRASDSLYNGNYRYSREIRKSEYLYDGTDAGSTDAKNLQIYITYRIAVKNQGNVCTTVDEIVDYYDADKYEFDGTQTADGKYSIKSYNNYDSNGNVTGTHVNSYIGKDANGGQYDNSLKVSNNTSFKDRTASETISGNNYNYSTLYLTGIKSVNGNERLNPGELAYAYVTFKVKNDSSTGKVQLDEELDSGIEKLGKRNMAEINGYSTYYKEGATIPNYLKDNNETVDADVSKKIAGLIDTDSNPGSLYAKDLNDNGDIISSKNPVENRLEDDTDKAPNIKIIIDKKSEDNRSLTGYVYEDNRTETSDSAVTGNGKYDDGENKVNGATVELVELVQNVDENGIFVGSYSGEKIWYATAYTNFNQTPVIDSSRYYSGSGKAKVILSGTGVLSIDTFETGNGEYAFTSIPAGDFFIRFTYGDTTQTVLTNSNEDGQTGYEVNKIVGTDIDGLSGLNAKSYNGQDYKSTTYQNGISQDSNYNGINGFNSYDTQNYTNTDGNINNGTNKSSMYYYDIAKSASAQGVSDAKDVYGYRTNSNNWSKGANGSTLLNNRAEILSSFEKLGTYKYLDANGNTDEAAKKNSQMSMIKELMNNTKVVAQTGIINTEVEYNTKQTGNQGESNAIQYLINDIDLGLVERPEAQLKLTKEVANFKLVLANNQTLFDTNQSVNNLYYGKHTGHIVNYDKAFKGNIRLASVQVNPNNITEKPELLQGYLDDELMEGATIQLTYKLTVQNVGETDYLDKQFYYTGKTNNTDSSNISKTNANSVVDYVSNTIKYDKNYQDVDAAWNLKSANELTNSTNITTDNKVSTDEAKIDADFVNRQYFENLLTYNSMLTTNKLMSDLLPTSAGKDNSEASTTLVVATLMSKNNTGDNLVYNNLAEIVETSNSQGRRMQYSIVGNQEMTDQSLGNNAAIKVLTTADLVTPSEIDADSAQKVVLMPPTGANKNYVPIILAVVAMLGLIVTSIVVIKKKVLGNK